MIEGKVNAALRLLSDGDDAGVLSLDETISEDGPSVREILKEKHPDAQALPDRVTNASPGTEEPMDIHPVFFDRITGATVRAAALKLSGSAGPSGIDAAGWRRLCVSFHSASKELCNAIAELARRICTQFIDPTSMQAFVACRLIPLNKNPGVRPIGVCECLRRLIGKAVLSVVGPYVREVTGALQLCAGQDAGIEAAIHAMSDIFNAEETDAILLVDARNAFNNLNRRAALFNVNRLCPAIGKILINTYRSAADLYVGGEIVKSQEGTTQGDPLAMAMYAIATIPLLKEAQTPSSTQVWFADDATSGGKLTGLRSWWDTLATSGPDYGYDINAPKSWLIVKPDRHEQAKKIFSDTNINITVDGGRHLGAVLESKPFAAKYLEEKMAKWTSEVKTLSQFAVTQPHAAYSAFTHSLSSHWTYLCRTMPGVAPLFQPVEDVIRTKLIPAMLGRTAPGDPERAILALPARLGGLGLTNPVLSNDSYDQSLKLTAPLVEQIKQQSLSLGNIPAEQQRLKQEIHNERRKNKFLPQASSGQLYQKAFNVRYLLPLSGGLPRGFQPCLWQLMGFTYQSLHSGMPSICDMGGHHQIYHRSVLVAGHLIPTMR